MIKAAPFSKLQNPRCVCFSYIVYSSQLLLADYYGLIKISNLIFFHD